MTDGNVDAADGHGAPARGDDGEFFREGTFNDWIGLAVEECGDGEAVLSVDCEAFKRNPAGTVHGGVTATLIDVAAGVAIGSTFEDPARGKATTNLEVNYLRPVTETAYAAAEVVRAGDTDAVARVEVESTAPDGERKTVAVGTVTYRIH